MKLDLRPDGSIWYNQTPADRVAETLGGPRMMEHREVRAGRPTSLLDLWAWNGGLFPRNEQAHVVPKDRVFSTAGARLVLFPHALPQFEQVSIAELHREFGNTTFDRRGRRSAFWAFDLAILAQWRTAVFDGDLTIKDLARAAGTTYGPAFKFAHGETLWWV